MSLAQEAKHGTLEAALENVETQLVRGGSCKTLHRWMTNPKHNVIDPSVLLHLQGKVLSAIAASVASVAVSWPSRRPLSSVRFHLPFCSQHLAPACRTRCAQPPPARRAPPTPWGTSSWSPTWRQTAACLPRCAPAALWSWPAARSSQRTMSWVAAATRWPLTLWMAAPSSEPIGR